MAFHWLNTIFKGIDHRKMQIGINCSPSSRLKHVRPSFIFGPQLTIFLIKSESFLTLHTDSNATTMFKAQKGSKDIAKIVHVTSVVQL